MGHKQILNQLEATSPGSKLAFVQEFVEKAQPRLRSEGTSPPRTCESCGMPSHGDLCSRCRLLREVASKRERRSALR